MRASRTWVNLIGLLLLAVLGLAQSAWSQPQVTRGGALKKRAYQTYTAMTLYVDPTGSDSGSCTSTGTEACLTLAGALVKLPPYLRHNVTINVAAGTYAETFNLPTFNVLSGSTLRISGTFVNATLGSGNVTGTTTSGTAASTSAPTGFTDSGQSWTTDALKGLYVTYTSGAENGVSYPISSNTATTISYPSFTTPAAGVTYSIQTIGSVFTGAAGTIIGNSLAGSGSVSLQRLFLAPTSGTISIRAGAVGILLLTNVTVDSTFTALSVLSGLIRPQRCYIYGRGVGTGLLLSSLLSAPAPSLNGSSMYLRSDTGPALRTSLVGPFATISGLVAEGGGVNAPVVSLNGAVSESVIGPLYITCSGSLANSVGLGSLPVSVANNNNAPSVSLRSVGAIRISGCDVAVLVTGRASYILNASVIASCATGFRATLGGQLNLGAATHTFISPSDGGVTNELQLDNSDTYTFSTLSGLPTPQVISNSYGSTFIR